MLGYYLATYAAQRMDMLLQRVKINSIESLAEDNENHNFEEAERTYTLAYALESWRPALLRTRQLAWKLFHSSGATAACKFPS